MLISLKRDDCESGVKFTNGCTKLSFNAIIRLIMLSDAELSHLSSEKNPQLFWICETVATIISQDICKKLPLNSYEKP